MDTFAALALATDPASPALLDRIPDKQTAPLFTVNMYKHILLQSIYQITIILLFHFLSVKILGFQLTLANDTIVQTVVFITFVFAQIFNSVNSRQLTRKLNIFEGILSNWCSMVITIIEIAVQVTIAFIGGTVFQVTHIGGCEWGISLAFGFVSIPLGALIRLFPNQPFEKLFILIALTAEVSRWSSQSTPITVCSCPVGLSMRQYPFRFPFALLTLPSPVSRRLTGHRPVYAAPLRTYYSASSALCLRHIIGLPSSPVILVDRDPHR